MNAIPETKRLKFYETWWGVTLLVVAGFVLLGVIGVYFAKAIQVPVPTSQGEIIRTSFQYKSKTDLNSEGSHKTMAFQFQRPDWYEDADKLVLIQDICEYIKNSDWGSMGITPQNSTTIIILIHGSATSPGIHTDCKKELAN